MRSERGLSTILHCLQWYKLVLRTALIHSSSAVSSMYRVINTQDAIPVLRNVQEKKNTENTIYEMICLSNYSFAILLTSIL